jgi:hypothetical protein
MYPTYSWDLSDHSAIAGNVAISVCYQQGLLPPLEEDGQYFFRPDLPLTHEEMVAAVAKAAAFLGHPPKDLETFTVDHPPLLRHQAAAILLEVMQQNGLIMIPVSGSCREYTIPEGATLIPPEGKALTMTVDGIETPLVPGTYRGAVVLTVASK